MATTLNPETTVSLKEYLTTSYEHDPEYVNGTIVWRSMPTQLHSLLQGIVLRFFHGLSKAYGFTVFTEVRMRMASGNHRVPDVMVVTHPYQRGKYMLDTPAITVEINSPDDKFEDIMAKCFEYDQLGVQNIIVMDPELQQAWRFAAGSFKLLESTAELMIGDRALEFPVDDLFHEMDDTYSQGTIA